MANSNFAFDYDLDLFEERQTENNTSAAKTATVKSSAAAKPLEKRVPERKNRLHLVEETSVTQMQREYLEEKKSFLNSMKIICVAMIAIALIGSLVYQRVCINTLDHAIAQKQDELDEAKSQNVILNIKRDSMVSTDSIRKTADELGMIQRDRYQITYFDLSEDDYGVVNPDAADN